MAIRTFVSASVVAGAVVFSFAQNAWASCEYSSSYGDECTEGEAIAVDVSRASSQSVARAINRRLATSTAPRAGVRAQNAALEPQTIETGLSGGSAGAATGVWGSVAYTSMENDFTPARYDGGMTLGTIGIDRKVTDSVVVGGTVSWERTSLDTPANQGNIMAEGFTFAPYLGYAFTDTLNLHLLAAYSSVNTDVERGQGATFAKGEYETDRFMMAASLRQYYPIGNWMLESDVGYMLSHDKSESYSLNNGVNNARATSTLAEGSLGGSVSYGFGMFEPYIGASYLYDFVMTRSGSPAGTAQPANDQDELELRGGVRLFASDSLSGGLEVSHGFLREEQDNTTVAADLRYQF